MGTSFGISQTKQISMLKFQERHSKGSQWCKINIDLFNFFWLCLSPSKMEGVTNESVNKEQQAQNLENLKYDPLENSGNLLFGNSSDPDLHFTYCSKNFLGDDKDENVSVLHLNIRSINKDFEIFKMFLSNLNLSFSRI